jgi:hypothetical protein
VGDDHCLQCIRIEVHTLATRSVCQKQDWAMIIADEILGLAVALQKAMLKGQQTRMARGSAIGLDGRLALNLCSLRCRSGRPEYDKQCGYLYESIGA